MSLDVVGSRVEFEDVGFCHAVGFHGEVDDGVVQEFIEGGFAAKRHEVPFENGWAAGQKPGVGKKIAGRLGIGIRGWNFIGHRVNNVPAPDGRCQEDSRHGLFALRG